MDDSKLIVMESDLSFYSCYNKLGIVVCFGFSSLIC
jgi:hypothetical protein